MSGSRAILLRLSVQDADVVRQQLVSMGEQGEAALQRLDAAAKRTAGGAGAGGGGGGMGGLGQAVGQAGFQIQDFATQVAMGQNALTAFSTQASQFLGVFGTTGAIAGALLTVGLLATQFLGVGKNSDDAGEAIKKFTTQLAEASREGNQLADVLARVEARLVSAGEAGRRRRVRDLGADVDELGRRGNDALMRSVNRDQEAQALEARQSFLRGLLRPENGLGINDTRPIQAELVQVEGAIASARRDAANLRAEVDRIDALRGQTQEMLRLEASGRDLGEGEFGPPVPGAAPARAARAAAAPRAARDPIGEESLRLIRETETAYERYQRRIEEIGSIAARARETGNPIPEEVIGRATAAALADFERLKRGVTETTRSANDLGRELGMTFSSAFEDAIVKGKELSEVLAGIAQDIARMIVRQTITAPLAGAFSSAIGGLFPAGGTFSVGKLMSSGPFGGYGGAKAEGGPVSAGMTYLVGERGPELFVPGASGSIVPNHAMGGGGGVVLNLNIDARGAGPREVDMLRGQIPAIARAAVEDAVRRGGGFSRAVRG